MGRSVICDENLIEFLENISSESGYILGLILGQFSAKKDYVIHLPRLYEQEEIEDSNKVATNTFSKLVDIKESSVSQHARNVTRMLPGGMWVLGIYVVSSGDIFSEKNSLNKLRSLAYAVHSCSKGNEFMYARDPSNQKLIMHFSSLSKKYLCKSFDMNTLNSSLRPVDWKFKTNITNWVRVDCNINFNWFPSFVIPDNKLTTKGKLQEILSQFQQHLNTLVYFINHEFSPDDKKLLAIEKISKSKSNEKENEAEEELEEEEEDNTLHLSFYQYNEVYSKDELCGKKYPLHSLIKLGGVIGSLVFLNDNATAEEAVKAAKEDLLRSFASRLEMHFQTYEEPQKLPRSFTVKRPPRRILFTPQDSEISFSEYIFEGENNTDALATISENLGFMDGETFALESEWEIPAMFDDTRQEIKPEPSVETTKNINQKGHSSSPPSNKMMLFGLIAAIFSLFVSLIIHFLYF